MIRLVGYAGFAGPLTRCDGDLPLYCHPDPVLPYVAVVLPQYGKVVPPIPVLPSHPCCTAAPHLQYGEVHPPAMVVPGTASAEAKAAATEARRRHPLFSSAILMLLTEVINSRLFTTVGGVFDYSRCTCLHQFTCCRASAKMFVCLDCVLRAQDGHMGGVVWRAPCAISASVFNGGEPDQENEPKQTWGDLYEIPVPKNNK